jgi:hypothetical protein
MKCSKNIQLYIDTNQNLSHYPTLQALLLSTNPISNTGSPQFALVQFAPIQNSGGQKEKKNVLLLFIMFYNFSRTASYTKS